MAASQLSQGVCSSVYILHCYIASMARLFTLLRQLSVMAWLGHLEDGYTYILICTKHVR